MYRVGFGDCFLVTLPLTGGGVRHVLVDCGVHAKGNIGTIDEVVDDIAAVTDKKLAIVIATHAHQDHISGFDPQKFGKFEIGEVWMPWSEDPNDPKAAKLKKKHVALAQQLAEQSLGRFRELGDTPFSAFALGLLGLIRLEQGELEAARPLLEDGLATGKQMGMETDTMHLRLGLARLLAAQGDAAAARRLYHEGLTLLFECHVYRESIAASLEGLAALEAAQGAPRQAVWLWGAAHALREAIGAPMHPVSRAGYEHALAHARAQLGEQTFHTLWAEGRNMTPEQALRTVTSNAAELLGKEKELGAVAPGYFADLVAVEGDPVEVLRLLAQGWSDAQIAEHLVLSPRTVNRHTASLYSKLGVSSRAAATRYAIEHHVL